MDDAFVPAPDAGAEVVAGAGAGAGAGSVVRAATDGGGCVVGAGGVHAAAPARVTTPSTHATP